MKERFTEEIEGLIAQAVSGGREAGLLGENRLSVVTDSFTEMMYCTACAGGLQAMENLSEGDPLVIVSHVMDGYVDEDIFLTFTDWLINKSPWHSAFISNDPRQVYDERYFVLDCTVPSNIMIGGIIASRTLWEYTYISKMFKPLVEAGILPNLAYLIANKARLSDEGVRFDNKMNGHHATWNDLNKEYVANFIFSNPVKLQDSYQKTLNYVGINVTWGCNEFGSDYLQRHLDVIDYRETSLDGHPFKASVLKVRENTRGHNTKSLPIEEAVLAAKDVADTIMGEMS